MRKEIDSMKKQFFAMAFAGLAMAVLAESEDNR